MVCFGAVLLDSELKTTFYGRTRPISTHWNAEALAISGIARDEHEGFEDPAQVMGDFERWVLEHGKGRPIFVSDNVAYDWQWINYYFHTYLGRNPFGYSGRRLSDLYCGLVKDSFASWKHLRRTAHDHHPVNDAIGNAEVILYMKNELGLKLKL